MTHTSKDGISEFLNKLFSLTGSKQVEDGPHFPPTAITVTSNEDIHQLLQIHTRILTDLIEQNNKTKDTLAHIVNAISLLAERQLDQVHRLDKIIELLVKNSAYTCR